MESLFNRKDKPFMQHGPVKICKHLQRTQCSLLLLHSEDMEEYVDTVKIFRANHDAVNITYNLCDLPEIPSRDKQVNEARLALNNSSKHDAILKSMDYDEAAQVYLLKLKPYPVFVNQFDNLNQESVQMSSALPKANITDKDSNLKNVRLLPNPF